MSFGHVLYYPWIEVRDAAWLKNAVLYWDKVSTIVPYTEDTAEPYTAETERALAERGWLEPLWLLDDSQEVQRSSLDFIRLLDNEEWRTQLRKKSKAEPLSEHRTRLEQFTRVHSIKFSPELLDILLGGKHPWEEVFDELLAPDSYDRKPLARDSQWLSLNSDIFVIYMTILAGYLGVQHHFAMATDESGLAPLAESMILRTPVPGTIKSDNASLSTSAFTALQPMHYDRSAVEAALAQCTIDWVSIDKATPVNKVIRFRERYRDELDRFRSAIGRLAEDFDQEHPSPEAFQQTVLDTFNDTIRPAVGELKRARRGMRLKAGPDLLKASVFASAPVLLGLLAPQPIGLIAAAGLSISALAVKCEVETRETLAKDPFSFVLHARRELGGRQGN